MGAAPERFRDTKPRPQLRERFSGRGVGGQDLRGSQELSRARLTEPSGFWQREAEERLRTTNGTTGPKDQLQQLVAGLGGREPARAHAERQGGAQT